MLQKPKKVFFSFEQLLLGKRQTWRHARKIKKHEIYIEGCIKNTTITIRSGLCILFLHQKKN